MRDSRFNSGSPNLSDAIAADRKGDLELAIALYERVVGEGEAPLEALLNLAVLYWQTTDPGMAAAKKFGPEFLSVAYRRCRELLAEAQLRFPTSTEPRFWTRYIAWADLGEPFGIEECRALLHEDPSVLLPAMHIFAISQGAEARDQALELLRRYQEDGTTRAKYVISVIGSDLERPGRR